MEKKTFFLNITGIIKKDFNMQKQMLLINLILPVGRERILMVKEHLES